MTTSNIFLDEIDSIYEEPEEEDITEENIFFSDIPTQSPEEKLPKIAKKAEQARSALTETTKRSPRYLMQGAIGSALGRLLLSPAGIPLLIASVATPGAIKGQLLDEEAFERELPQRIRDALDLPEFKPEVAQKASQDLYQKIAGPRGPIDRLVQAPFELAGIETEPQTPGEEAIRFSSELISGLGGPETFTQLVFEELPSSLKRFFNNKPQELLKKLIGKEPLPDSVYDTATKILEEFQEREALQAPKSLQGRISKGGKPLEVSPPKDVKGEITEAPHGPSEQLIFEEAGETISPHKFSTEFEGGTTQYKAIQETAKEARKVLNEAYDAAEQAYQNTSDIYPNLVTRLEEARDKILARRDPKLLNTAEKNVVDSINNLLDSLVTSDGSFIEQPVSVLLKTAKSWSSKLSHEEIFGDVKRFLSKLIPDINEAGLAAVERQGISPDLLRDADRMYADWASRYANDEISPYLQTSIRNPEALFRKSLSDEGTYRAVKGALEGSAFEDVISNATAREIATTRLDKYLKDIKKVGNVDYEKEIRNLEPLIGEKPTQDIDKYLRNKKKEIYPEPKPPFKAERKPIGRTPLPSPLKGAEKKVSQFLEMSPEEIIKKGKTRSGLKELKKELEKTPRGKNLYNMFRRQRIRDVLQENQLTRKMKGKDLFNVLNKRENFEILSELIGEEETRAALDAAKELADKRFSSEALSKIGKNVLALKFYRILLEMLP